MSEHVADEWQGLLAHENLNDEEGTVVTLVVGEIVVVGRGVVGVVGRGVVGVVGFGVVGVVESGRVVVAMVTVDGV